MLTFVDYHNPSTFPLKPEYDRQMQSEVLKQSLASITQLIGKLQVENDRLLIYLIIKTIHCAEYSNELLSWSTG